MKIHSKCQNIQLAATACLYNLTKHELSEKISLIRLNYIVDVVLKLMGNFPNALQV
jgi:Zyg-11 family protein